MSKQLTKKLIGEPVLLQIAQLGNRIIRSVAKEVKRIDDPAIQQLIDDMIATCVDANGVGIAAPQAYSGLRIFIVASAPSPRYPHAPKMKPTAIINPKIIFASKEMKKDWEGCLSIPGIRGIVSRHQLIKVEYTDRTGKKQTKTFKDFIARIFQHEYDHLEGIVFLDRTDSKDLVTEREYQKIMSKKK